jgi:hypothetical protein
MYKSLAKAYGWSLYDMEQTNLETLVEYLNTELPETEKVIGGKTYRLATQAPAFL